MKKKQTSVLKEDLEEYEGKWVALVQGRIVASGSNAKKVYGEAKNKHPKEEPLMDKVYGKRILIV
jgi:hypothetical protein